MQGMPRPIALSEKDLTAALHMTQLSLPYIFCEQCSDPTRDAAGSNQAPDVALNLVQIMMSVCHTSGSAQQLGSVVCDFQQRQVASRINNSQMYTRNHGTETLPMFAVACACV